MLNNLHQLETQILFAFESWRTPAFTSFFNPITHLGGTKSLVIFILLLTLILVVKKFYKEAGILAGGMLTGVTISQTLKHLINRTRPDVISHLTDFSSASFPSGHAMNNMLLATLLTYLSWRMFKNKRTSIIVGMLSYAWALIVGMSRLYLGVHWPSDVLAGWIFGLLVGLGVIWGARRAKGLRFKARGNVKFKM